MKFLQIKQAETALKDGRLDEACRIIEQADVQEYAKAQKLIGQLARAYADRAEKHLENDLCSEAYADCCKAEKLAGSDPEIAVLKDRINQAILRKHAENADQVAMVTQARNHLKKGDISACENLIASVDKDYGKVLQNQATDQRQKLNLLLRKLDHALRQKDIHLTVSILKSANWRDLINRDDELAVLISRIRIEFCARLRLALQSGRIDQAQMMAQQGESVVSDMLDFRELQRIIQKLLNAQCAVEHCHPQDAARILTQVRSMLPDAPWLTTAEEYARQAAQAVEALKNGPLGLMITGQSMKGWQDTVHNESLSDSASQQRMKDVEMLPVHNEPALPQRFVIQVDGVGSYLVFPGNRISVGPISSSRRPDLGVMADATGAVVTIERFEEDYLLMSDQPVMVNKKPTHKSILNDNDRIDLTHRISMKFKKPNPASSTALLDLASARMPSQDIRYAVLLNRELVFGPGSGSHVRDDGWSDQFALSYRDGHLFCDKRDLVTLRDQPLNRELPLPIGQPLRIGQASLVITPYDRE